MPRWIQDFGVLYPSDMYKVFEGFAYAQQLIFDAGNKARIVGI